MSDQNRETIFYNEDEYGEVRYLDLLMIIGTPLFVLAYYIIDWWREIVSLNMEYIFSTADIIAVYIFCVLMPFILYWIKLIIRIIRYFWVSYDVVDVRIYTTYFRINFSIFGFLSSFLVLALNTPFSTWYIPITSLVIVIGANLFFGKKLYENIQKEEIKKAEMNESEKKMELTYSQGFIIIAFLVGLIFYYGTPELKESVDGVSSLISNDISLSIIFWISVALSPLWFLTSWLSTAIYNWLLNREDKLKWILSLILFFGLIYFITKIIIFNLPMFIDEPYPTFVSMGISLLSGVIKAKYKVVYDFIKRKRGK